MTDPALPPTAPAVPTAPPRLAGPRRTVALMALLLGLASTGYGQAPAREGATEPPEEVYLSVRYENVVDTLLSARYHDGAVYLPVGELFTLLRLDWTWEERTGRLAGFLFERRNRYVLDVNDGHALVSGQTSALPASDVLPEPLDLYLHVRALERLFALRAEVDLARLEVRITAAVKLPVLAWAERRRSRRALYDPLAAFQHSPLHYEPPRRMRPEGGVMDYRLARTGHGRGSTYTLDAKLGGRILGGALGVSLRGTTGGTRPFDRATARWRYLFPPGGLLSRLEVGQLVHAGAAARSFYGLSITNAPAEPDPVLGMDALQGTTGAGWDVELYLDDQLAAVGQADALGAYRFPIPIVYGTTVASVRSYGPTGEAAERRVRLEVPRTLLPPGAVRYALQLGRAAGDTGRLLAFASAGVGLSTWLTARLEIDRAPHLRTARVIPRARLSARLGAPYGLDLEAGADRYAATMSGHFASGALLQLGYTRYTGSQMRRLDVWAAREAHGQASLFLPIERAPLPLSVRFGYDYERFRGRSVLRLRGGAQAGLGMLRLALHGERRATRRASPAHPGAKITRLSGTASYDLRKLGVALLKGLQLGAQVRYDAGQRLLQDVRFGVTHNTRRFGQLRVTLSPPVGGQPGSIGLRFSYDAQQARVSTSAAVRGGGRGVHAQTVSGSIVSDPVSRRLLLHNRRVVGQGGVALRVFVDHDGDGRRGAEEPVLERARLRVNGGVRVDGANGEAARYLGLRPGVRYEVELDPASVANPMLMAEHERFSFIAEANTVRCIEVPLLVVGAAEGVVRRSREGAVGPVAGVDVHLRRLEDGEQRTERTFSDGTFYSLNLLPGTYEARVDPGQLARLGARSEPAVLRFTVERTQHGDYVEGLAFELHDRDPAPPHR